jgi:hypothetical protein
MVRRSVRFFVVAKRVALGPTGTFNDAFQMALPGNRPL